MALVGTLLWLGSKLLEFVAISVFAIVIIALVLGFLFLCLLAVGKVMELFVKEVKDPDLGVVRIGFGQCDGKIVIEGRRRLAFQLPAAKKQIVAEARALLLNVKADWPRLENLLLGHFAREVENDGVPPDLIKRAKWVEKIAKEGDLENLRKFTRLQNINVEYADKNGPLEVRIETIHRWDPEHERVLILDEKLNVKLYALGCQC
jgi:hypothetical protein